MIKLRQIMIAGTASLAIVGSVFAVGGPNAKAQDVQQSAQDRKAALAQTVADRHEMVAVKLADAKLKACQRRETVVDNIMARIADRGVRQIDVFNKIADRTESFYSSKGKPLSNYDTLVADVNAKKMSAQTTVDAVKTSSAAFKCDGTDPMGAASSFKASLKTEISALKAYKTAVKNLIVGVKSAQGVASSSDKSTNDKTEGAQQ